MTKPIKSISKETGKINIVPTFENLLITYVRLYSRMNVKGQKLIEVELTKMGKTLDFYGCSDLKKYPSKLHEIKADVVDYLKTKDGKDYIDLATTQDK